MKIKHWLMLVTGMTLSTVSVAEESHRQHLKCYLQIEDLRYIVHHFVNTGQDDKQFVASLTEKTVFMKDGVTEQKIIKVSECVGINHRFKSQKAINVEKNTPF